jgi:hypothetical protein
MKNLVILLLLATIFSCTKPLVVQPSDGKESTKLEITKTLGEKRSSNNNYHVIIIDHEKNSKIEYPVPKDKKWRLPLNLTSSQCQTMGEEVGTKEFFLMELYCNGIEVDIASVVACGINDKSDAETIRLLKKGVPFFTLQLKCMHQ